MQDAVTVPGRMEEDLQHLTPEVLYDLGQERSPPHEDGIHLDVTE